jgi:cell division protein ZapD
VVSYEFPLTEGLRTTLRLAALIDRLEVQATSDAAVDHHGALVTLFEIADIAARVEIKGDLLRELERHRAALQALQAHPAVDRGVLRETLAQLASSHEALLATTGRLGPQLASNDFLVSIKSRISIPAGTCEFDLPAFHAWKQREPQRRRADLVAWRQPLAPYARALRLVLDLVRGGGEPRPELARGGTFQLNLAGPRPVVLVRLRVPADEPTSAVPEVSGHRLLLSIRMMRLEDDGQLRPVVGDVPFTLTLCAGP